MRKLLLTVILFSGLFSQAQTKLYVHPDGKTYASNTKTIAILPLKVQVKLRPKQLKDFTTEQIIQLQKDEAIDIQKAMHTWFLTRKKRGSFDAKVVTPARANALLKKADIDVHELDAYLPSNLSSSAILPAFLDARTNWRILRSYFDSAAI